MTRNDGLDSLRETSGTLRHLLALSLLLLAGCATAPATGKRIFTAGLTLTAEAELGHSLHEELRRLPGGLYEDARLQSYLERVGAAVAAAANAPHALRFAVLDQSRIYAGAVPGGYIYISRGLLAQLADEAELAAILAHEAAHIAARHGAERLGLQLLRGQQSVAVARLSRGQEEEADRLALAILARAGYDPAALVTSLRRIGRAERLEAELLSRPGLLKAEPNDDHPLTEVRVAALETAVTGFGPGRDGKIFLSLLQGLPFGAGREEGFFLGARFVRPSEGIGLTLADGWGAELQPGVLIASRGPDSLLHLDSEPEEPGLALTEYLRRRWPGGHLYDRAQPVRLGGLEGAIAEARDREEGSPGPGIRLYAVARQGGRIHRLFLRAPGGPGVSEELHAMAASLSPATEEEQRLAAPRLSLHQVAAGETVAMLASAFPRHGTALPDYGERLFRLINDLPEGAEVTPGAVVKLAAP